MQYQGGKGRIARRIVEVMLRAAPNKTRWVEPFVGGSWVLAEAGKASQFESLHAGDALEDMILLYRAVAQGWAPPTEVTREDHAWLKTQPPSPVRAFYGTACSFAGTWFTGWCGDRLNGRRTYAALGAGHLARRRSIYRRTDLRHQDYREWGPVIGHDALLYCDPPFAGATQYRGASNSFDSEEFWSWCQQMADRGAAVFVSEYNRPSTVQVIELWSREAKQTVAPAATQKVVTERLFQVLPTEKEQR